MKHNNKNALIAMSGGVDSSVTAYLMKEAGYNCHGTNMRLYHNTMPPTWPSGWACPLR